MHSGHASKCIICSTIYAQNKEKIDNNNKNNGKFSKFIFVLFITQSDNLSIVNFCYYLYTEAEAEVN